MNTNDPKAPYGEKRDPMLSDLQALEVAYPHVEYGGDCSFYGTDALFSIRDFYEAKITSGELRVVKTIPRSEARDHVLNCHEDMASAMDTGFANYILFCPGCGAQIVK